MVVPSASTVASTCARTVMRPCAKATSTRLALPHVAVVAADGVEGARAALRHLRVERLLERRRRHRRVHHHARRRRIGDREARDGGRSRRVDCLGAAGATRRDDATANAHRSDVRMMADGSTRIAATLWLALAAAGCWNAVDAHCPGCAVVSERAPRLPSLPPDTRAVVIIVHGAFGFGDEWREVVDTVRARPQDGADRVFVERAVDAQAVAGGGGAAPDRAARRRRRAAARADPGDRALGRRRAGLLRGRAAARAARGGACASSASPRRRA